MNRLFAIILLSIACIDLQAQNDLGGIGQWRGHFNNHSIKNVVKGDYIYAASPYQIIALDNKNPIHWIDKSTGLNDIGIEHMAWDENQEQLIITYANSNIDIVKGDNVFNINAIQLTNLYPFRKINSIQVLNNYGYLSTAFGIVVIDLIKHEIKDTWYPNNNQQSTNTFDVTIAHDTIFATTVNGIWACPLKNNWIQYNQWVHYSNFDSLNLKGIIQQNQLIYAYNNNSIFKLSDGKQVYKISNGNIESIDTTLNSIHINVHYPTKKGALIQLNKDYSTSIIIDTNQLKFPMQSILDNNQYWVADSSMGLLHKSTGIEWITPGGPMSNLNGTLSVNENFLLAPFGENDLGYAQFNDNKWDQIQQVGNTILPNLNASYISKRDQSFWFTTNNGLIHLTNENKQIDVILPNKNGGAFKQIQIDQNQMAWVTQDQQGLVRQTDNSWNNISAPINFSTKGLDKFIVNNQQQAWMIAPNKQGIYIYQSKDVYGTEAWKMLITGQNTGNLPSNNVTSIANDKMGSIWVGTDNGIAIFNCGNISTEPCNAFLPIVKNNGFNGYLFQKEVVNAIAIDGANRKWVGTNNGAWLLSEDGINIIEHFTKNNSPLPSDSIIQIVIDPKNGEVFFNTKTQMVSYRSTATEGATNQQNIQIFPNPVPPNFNGLIAIKGLVDNAVVKITDLAGKLLYQTRALGGQAVWNARTYEGRQVATGIYLVFVRDIDGNERGISKIVIAEGY
jgi:ligand-binding sensor domain-containing protein